MQDKEKGFWVKEPDLVEVVRCKDCKWYTVKKNTAYNGHFCDKIIEFVDAYDFCSFAERRNDG